MDTLESLGKRIATTEELRSIVRTMKSLSAVSIRQYDRAVVALRDYSRSVEMGLQVVLLHERPPYAESHGPEGATIALVFGSDHGLCGRFNHEISRFARRDLRERGAAPENTRYLVVGVRAAAQLEAAGEEVAQSLLLPGSVDGLTETAQSVLLTIDAWRAENPVGRVLLFHNRRTEGATAQPHGVQLLPFDPAWLRDLAARRWPSRARPTYTMDTAALFSALARQYLFVEVFRAGAESAASEHAMRLAAMQTAERNIEENLEEMNTEYRHKRQESITEELLDVVAGFETLTAAPQATP